MIRIDDPDAERPEFRRYTTGDGLSGNRIEVITEDLHGRIYAATGRGIDQLEPATGRVRHFTTEDGLASGWTPTAFRDRSGALWFGTHIGLSRFLPAAAEPSAPPAIADPMPLGVDIRRDLYLIFKEAVNNAARHSRCSTVAIVLRADRGGLCLEVNDDGEGFETDEGSDGNGLASMRRRAARLGASLDVTSGPGAGTSVRLRMPLREGRAPVPTATRKGR